MEVVRRSPMLGILAALVAGMGLYDKVGAWAFVVVPVIFAGVMLCSYERDIVGQWKIFSCAMILAGLCSVRVYHEISKPPAESLTLHNATGVVISSRQWGRIYAAVIDVDGVGKFVTRLQFSELIWGTRIEFDGATQSFSKSRGDFDEARYWKARGVKGWISIYNVHELPGKISMAGMRYKLSRALSIYMPNLTASYLRAAWLGERNDALNIQHRKWGTSHLLAVSGFHVGLVILCAGIFFGGDVVILSVILWAYVLLTGAAPSALRAGLMIQMGLIARALGRPVSGVNSVSLAAIILLMHSPFYFWDIGLRLSVLSALVISAMPLRKISWLVISPAISLVTFPQVAHAFNFVPVVGVVLNLFAPLYFSVAFSAASLVAFMRLVNFPLSQYFALAVEGMFMLWEVLADAFTELLPYFTGWNNFIAWLGTGALIYFLCKYFMFSPVKTFVLMVVGSFAAFVIFL